MANKSMTPDEKQVMNTVRKDVLRTDRHHRSVWIRFIVIMTFNKTS